MLIWLLDVCSIVNALVAVCNVCFRSGLWQWWWWVWRWVVVAVLKEIRGGDLEDKQCSISWYFSYRMSYGIEEEEEKEEDEDDEDKRLKYKWKAACVSSG